MLTQTINKTFKLYKKQLDFVNSKAVFRGFCAGINSGKSVIGAYDMIARRSKPGCFYMVVADSYPQLRDATFRTFLRVGNELGLIAEVTESPPQRVRLKNGAEVTFRSGDNPESLRGPNLSGVWLDEASLMTEDVFQIAIGRLREAQEFGGKAEFGWLTATFTPKGRANWTYRIFAKGSANTELIHARTDENPFAPPDFTQIVGGKYTRRFAAQELGGEFLADAGNHFMPGMWPRYNDHAENAWSVNLGPGIGRKTYVKRDCTIICAFDWAVNKVNRNKLKKVKEGVEETTDFCSIGAAALTPDGNLLMLDRINARIRMEVKAPTLAAFCRRWRPHHVVGDEDQIAEGVLLDTRRYRDIPEIQLLPLGSRNKLSRASAAIICGENGLIYLPEKRSDGTDDDWVQGFCDQLSTFTGVDDEHDDDVDMLGLIGRKRDLLKGDGREFDHMPEQLGAPPNLYGNAMREDGFDKTMMGATGQEPPPSMMSDFGRW